MVPVERRKDEHVLKNKCVRDTKDAVNACDTDPVGPGKLWFFNLEVEKSRHSDGVEKPGSEAENETKRNVEFCTRKDAKTLAVKV